MSQLLPPFNLIRDRLNQAKVIPFLGAGASLGERSPNVAWDNNLALGLPTSGELASYLADKVEFPLGEARNLAKVAQYYDIVGGRIPLNEELHNIFDHDYSLTQLHSCLASVPAPLLIVTSNYDDMIERAFTAQSRDYHVVVHTTDSTMGYQLLWWPPGEEKPQKIVPNKLDIDLERETVVYKMHGAVDRHDPTRDQYVVTEDDYIDFLARMTKNRAIPSIFSRAFQTRHFLFLGYGLHDWNLRVVLNRIEKDLRRPKGIKSWSIQFQPSLLEQRFWLERGVDVYDMTVDEFIKELV